MALLFTPDLPAWGAARVGLGFVGMGNASVSVYALHPLELELGTEGSLGHNGWTARAGPALHVLDRRNEQGRGLTVHAPMMVGYRYLNFGREHPGHALTLTPTLTSSVWLASHLALELSLTTGVNITVADRSGGLGTPVLPDIKLQAGLAF